MRKKSGEKRKVSNYCGRQPYQYSDAYRNWRIARLAGRDAETRKFASAHARQFGYALGSSKHSSDDE